jgi:crotonobetainyl-CoA:carnitine CoA-transferase CaiB-like acyl-CoA transferase
MARWCAERGTDEVLEILGKAMIPCGPLLAPQETLDHPQVAALGLLEPLDYPGLPKPAPVGRVPVTLSRTEPVERRPPPVLGADSDAVLGELGYSPSEIGRLRADGVI